MKRLLMLSVPVLAAIAAALTGVASAAGGEKGHRPPPWSERCGMEIRGYSDGSASLYCDGRRKPFAVIDPESGRVRFFIPD
jgi:hypothetical protein